MAARLVWGGVCSSAWSYYWDNRTISPITNPKGLTLKYVDDYDKTGFLHNKYLVDFINNHNKEYSSEIEFLDEFYPIVSEQICKDYSLSIQDFNKINPRNLMLDKLILISNSYSDDNVVLVNNLSNNLLITSGSKILTEKFKKIMSEVTKYDISNYIVIDNIIEKEILNVKTDTTINKTEKEVVLHSINLLKYSYKLWSIN